MNRAEIRDLAVQGFMYLEQETLSIWLHNEKPVEEVLVLLKKERLPDWMREAVITMYAEAMDSNDEYGASLGHPWHRDIVDAVIVGDRL